MIWSSKAIDYGQGFKITHCKTNLTYTEEEANLLPNDVKKNLVLRPNKIGTNVLTIKECKVIMNGKAKSELQNL